MLKKHAMKVVASAALYTGSKTANTACYGPYYQPKMPAKLLKK